MVGLEMTSITIRHAAIFCVCLLAFPTVAWSFGETIGLHYLVNYHSFIFNNRTHKPNHTSAPTPHHLVEGGIDIVLFNVSGGEQVPNYDEHTMSDFYAEEIVATSRNPKVAKVINATYLLHRKNQNHPGVRMDPSTITASDGEMEVILTVEISAHSIGKTVIDISILGYRTSDSQVNDSDWIQADYVHRRRSKHRESRAFGSFDVAVVRRTIYKTLGLAFTIFVATMTVFTTFLIGTKLEWKVVVKEIKKPSSLLIGIGLEFLIVPLIALAWAIVILRGNYSWQLVYLAIGACPGGGHSPFWTMMLDGNLDLAVAMSFVASVSALGVLPFWLFTVGRIFYAGHFSVPYVTITASLFGLVCPIFFGLLLKHFMPTVAEQIGRIVKHATVISFIAGGIFGCVVNSYVFALLDWRHLICGLLLPWCGYTITYPLARWVFRRSHADSIAIAVENGCLNVAVPTVLIQLTLSQPESDLSLVVPVGVVIFASLPLWFYFIALVIKRRMTMPVMPLQVPSTNTGSVENAEPKVAIQHRKSKGTDEIATEITITIVGKWNDKHPACVSDAFDASTQTGDKVIPEVAVVDMRGP